MDDLEVTVEKYSDRSFAVYVNGELLCVAAYRKGANAVKELPERLWRENTVLKEKVKAEVMARLSKIQDQTPTAANPTGCFLSKPPVHQLYHCWEIVKHQRS